MGSDKESLLFNTTIYVSIHAPAWGATLIFLIILLISFCFNPRSRMGSDRPYNDHNTMGGCFNPRSRMGSDYGELWGDPDKPVSIHAPAWGVTVIFELISC